MSGNQNRRDHKAVLRGKAVANDGDRAYLEVITGRDAAPPYLNCPLLKILNLHSRSKRSRGDPVSQGPEDSAYGAVFDASEVEVGQPPEEDYLDSISPEEESVLSELRTVGIEYRHTAEEMLSNHGMHIVSQEDEEAENARFREQEYHFKPKS